MPRTTFNGNANVPVTTQPKTGLDADAQRCIVERVHILGGSLLSDSEILIDSAPLDGDLSAVPDITRLFAEQEAFIRLLREKPRNVLKFMNIRVPLHCWQASCLPMKSWPGSFARILPWSSLRMKNKVQSMTLPKIKWTIRLRLLSLPFAVFFTALMVDFSFGKQAMHWLWAGFPLLATACVLLAVVSCAWFLSLNKRLASGGL